MKRIYLILLITLTASLILTGCSEKEKKNPPPPGVIVSPVVKQNVVDAMQIVGQVVAYDDVNLRARVEGFLDKKNFKDGQYVKKDDILFVIQKDQYQANMAAAQAKVASALAELQKAKLDYDRQKSLWEKHAVSKRDYDYAKCQYELAKAETLKAKANLAKAALDLQYTDIKAPFSGRVGIAQYSVGNLVGPSSLSLANVVKVDPIKVEFNIIESMVVDTMQEQAKSKQQGSGRSKLVVKVIMANGKPYKRSGKIEYYDNRINPQTGTIMLRAVFENPDFLLIPGEYVRVNLESKDEVEALLIPRSAIAENQAGKYVLVVNKDNKVELREIKTGSTYGANIVISSGLKEGEKVITQGLQKVRSGQIVKPTQDESYTDYGPQIYAQPAKDNKHLDLDPKQKKTDAKKPDLKKKPAKKTESGGGNDKK